MTDQSELFTKPQVSVPPPDDGGLADLLNLVVGPSRVLDCSRCGLRQTHTVVSENPDVADKHPAQCSVCGEIRAAVDSHGDGRRMARLGPERARAEAVERRERIVERWGSIVAAEEYADEVRGGGWASYGRAWSASYCVNWALNLCPALATNPGDVGIDSRGVPVAMCPDCRCAASIRRLAGGAS